VNAKVEPYDSLNDVMVVGMWCVVLCFIICVKVLLVVCRLYYLVFTGGPSARFSIPRNVC
jgi:hypothetical protein